MTSLRIQTKPTDKAKTVLKKIIQELREIQASLTENPPIKQTKHSLKVIETNLQQLEQIVRNNSTLTGLYQKAHAELELLKDSVAKGTVRSRSSRHQSKHATMTVETEDSPTIKTRQLKEMLLQKEQALIKLKGELNHSEHRLVVAQNQHQAAETAWRTKLEDLTKENRKLQKKLTKLQQTSNKVESLLERYKHQLESSEAEHSQKRLQLIEQIGQLKGQVETLTAQNHRLSQRNRELEQQKLDYENQTGRVLTTIEKELNQLNDQLAQQRVQKNQRGQIAEMLRSQMAQASMRLRESELELDQMKQANTMMKERFNKYEGTRSQEKEPEQVTDTLRKLDKISKEQHRNMKCLNSLREEIDKFKGRVD